MTRVAEANTVCLGMLRRLGHARSDLTLGVAQQIQAAYYCGGDFGILHSRQLRVRLAFRNLYKLL